MYLTTNQHSPSPQPIQLKQSQPSQYPIIQNTTPPNLRKPRRSISNLNQHRMIDIKNPPMRTSNQSLSFSLGTTAYESVSVAPSTSAPNDICHSHLQDFNREEPTPEPLTHNSPHHPSAAYISSTNPDYPFPRSIVEPLGRRARPGRVSCSSLVVGLWGGCPGG